MSNKYEDLIKNARMNAECGEHMSPAEVKTLLNVVETTFSELAAENAVMDSFVDALLSIAWQGGSADGAEIQELALKHGLLRQEVYSADEHETLVDDPGNFEDGDPVYFRVETPATDAFLAEGRAQGVEMLRDSIVDLESSIEDTIDLHHYCSDFAAEIRKGVQS